MRFERLAWGVHLGEGGHLLKGERPPVQPTQPLLERLGRCTTSPRSKEPLAAAPAAGPAAAFMTSVARPSAANATTLTKPTSALAYRACGLLGRSRTAMFGRVPHVRVEGRSRIADRPTTRPGRRSLRPGGRTHSRSRVPIRVVPPILARRSSACGSRQPARMPGPSPRALGCARRACRSHRLRTIRARNLCKEPRVRLPDSPKILRRHRERPWAARCAGGVPGHTQIDDAACRSGGPAHH